MNMLEIKSGWDTLGIWYNNLPPLTRERGELLHKVLGGFTADEFELAIEMWIESKKFQPSVSELKKYCFLARHKMDSRRRIGELEEGGVCPWCGGMGVVGIKQAYRSPGVWEDVYFPCQCYASHKPNVGKQIISEALDDTNWVFDKGTHSFVRRSEWIGDQDDTMATPQEIREVMDAAGKLIGGSLW